MVPYHHTCHHVSIYTPSRAFRSSSDEKENNSFVQDENLRVFWLAVILCSGSPCLEQTSNTAILSHSSKLLLKPFPLPPLWGILTNLQALDAVPDWLVITGGGGGGGGLGERKGSKGLQDVCVCVCVCVRECV